jgi:membrane-bound ClpP family serine protease
MNFWKDHTMLRITIITILFIMGLVLVVAGWKMTGQLVGLGIMMVGVVFLLTALLVYNKPFEDRKIKK